MRDGFVKSVTVEGETLYWCDKYKEFCTYADDKGNCKEPNMEGEIDVPREFTPIGAK